MACFSKCSAPASCIKGDAGVGKSELALELITRGHRLVADDVVDLKHVAPETLEGSCPPLIRDFLEVRGLGILNIRFLFGETAVKPQKNLKLIVELVHPQEIGEVGLNRLDMVASTETILGVAIPKVRIPVAAGRNLAVLVEVAVRNHILKSRGINPVEQFIKRQQAAIDGNELRCRSFWSRDCRARAKASPSRCWKTSAFTASTTCRWPCCSPWSTT